MSGATIQTEGLDPFAQQEPLLLEASEVARLLGIGRTKVYELIARRELPVICIGRCVRVPRALLQRWIAAHTAIAGVMAESESSQL
jgi:excisionase family DNA binding protein